MAGSASELLRESIVALRAAGERGNVNALRRGIRAEAQPLIAAARGAARDQLPRSGGLAEYEASQKIRVAVLAGARTAGVRIVGKASMDTDTGTWRHPTFGRAGKGQWREQTYGPAAGWWSKTMAERSPDATVLILAELVKVQASIMGV